MVVPHHSRILRWRVGVFLSLLHLPLHFICAVHLLSSVMLLFLRLLFCQGEGIPTDLFLCLSSCGYITHLLLIPVYKYYIQ